MMEKQIRTNIPEGERDLRIVVWENIERFRKQKGVSVESFCEANSFPIRTYKSNLKNDGASVSFPTIQKFAKYLGVNTVYLKTGLKIKKQPRFLPTSTKLLYHIGGIERGLI